MSRNDRGQSTVAAQARPVRPDADLDDATLVAAARANRQAFRPLYERNVDQIYRYCLLKLGSREAAEDATSEVFMRAVARLDTYHGGPFAGWLFRIAQNIVADDYRQRRRGPSGIASTGRSADPLEMAHEIMDPNPMPEEAAIARSEHEAVLAALVGLPTDQRALVELQLAGLSTNEIAVALGRGSGAVRMLRLRALRASAPPWPEPAWEARKEPLHAKSRPSAPAIRVTRPLLRAAEAQSRSSRATRTRSRPGARCPGGRRRQCTTRRAATFRADLWSRIEAQGGASGEPRIWTGPASTRTPPRIAL